MLPSPPRLPRVQSPLTPLPASVDEALDLLQTERDQRLDAERRLAEARSATNAAQEVMTAQWQRARDALRGLRNENTALQRQLELLRGGIPTTSPTSRGVTMGDLAGDSASANLSADLRAALTPLPPAARSIVIGQLSGGQQRAASASRAEAARSRPRQTTSDVASLDRAPRSSASRPPRGGAHAAATESASPASFAALQVAVEQLTVERNALLRALMVAQGSTLDDHDEDLRSGHQVPRLDRAMSPTSGPATTPGAIAADSSPLRSSTASASDSVAAAAVAGAGLVSAALRGVSLERAGRIAAEARVSALEARLAGEHEARMAALAAAGRAEAALRDELAAVRSEVAELRTAAVESAAALRASTARRSEEADLRRHMTDENEGLRRDLRVARAALAAAERQSDRKDHLTDEVARLREELRTSRAVQSSAEQRAEQADRTSRDLEAALSRSQQDLFDARKELDRALAFVRAVASSSPPRPVSSRPHGSPSLSDEAEVQQLLRTVAS